MVNHTKSSSRKISGSNHRSTLSLQKTEILINVYDLLPVGRLSSILWAVGSSLLHTGVVINNKEYAYGGHGHSGITGVYWTTPRIEPPGGTFRYEVLHGFTMHSEAELEQIIKDVSSDYLGPSYNLLRKNCNHFTSALCHSLTSREPPTWLNRAASIGIALPCLVPPEWLEPPDYETADGALLEEDDDDNERSRMLGGSRGRHQQSETSQDNTDLDSGHHLDDWNTDDDWRARDEGRRVTIARDTSGRRLPASEQAPIAHELQ